MEESHCTLAIDKKMCAHRSLNILQLFEMASYSRKLEEIKIVGAVLENLPANQQSQSSPIWDLGDRSHDFKASRNLHVLIVT